MSWRGRAGLRPRTPLWGEALNFAGPRVLTSFWSWVLLIAGAMAAVHAADLMRQHDEAMADVVAEQARLRSHVRRQEATPFEPARANEPAGANAASAAPPLRGEAWGPAAQFANWMSHPWAPALDQADASARKLGVAMTRFQLDLSAWGLRAGEPLPWRLQAAVVDDATALAWLDELGQDATLLRRDALPQPTAGERGTYRWRIDVAPAAGQP